LNQAHPPRRMGLFIFMRKHNYFPSALKVQDRECLVVGAVNDKEMIDKSARLRDAGARVTVVDPAAFSPDGISDQFFVVFCPKNMPELVRRVAERCKEKRVLLCAIDQPAYCDVVNVSVFDQGRLRMTIGTGGAAPAVSRKIRLGLEKSLGTTPLSQFLDDLADLRKKLESEMASPSERIPKLLAAVEGFEFEARVRFPEHWKPGAPGGTSQ
jgi:uroporphyrin-III C-methyltransferase/precorrin-2 dehydrogenase/sirohydrochlorin ferrochelatase